MITIKSKPTFWLVMGGAALISVLLLFGIGWVIWQKMIASGGQAKVLSLVPPVISTRIAVLSPTTKPITLTASPTAIPNILPTSTPKPTTFLVWSANSSYVELHAAPAGETKEKISNGTQIMLGEAQEIDGQAWVHVWQGGLDGWLKQGMVWQIQIDLPMRYVNGADGALLRQKPAGELVAALPQGTPVFIIETSSANGQEWAHVSLLDNREGWVANRLLGDTP